MAMLDTYLASAPAGTHRFEAGVFRRLGLAIEQRNAAIAAIPPAPVVRQDDKAREEELQKLRDDARRGERRAGARAPARRAASPLAQPTRNSSSERA
jgi:hypothetical protein